MAQPAPSPAPAPSDQAAPDQVATLGCRLNAFDSAVIEGHLAAARAQGPGAPEVVVVNTCGVTGEAVRQSRQRLRRARRDHPDARVVATGCAAQMDPAAFAAMPEVDAVVGTAEKMRGDTWADIARGRGAPVRVGDIMAEAEPPIAPAPAQPNRARAVVQVQTGCDHRCTFCVIPYGRGNARSTPAGAVVDQVRTLADAGAAEVVLTGVDLTSWGQDLPGRPPLGRLVRRILDGVPHLPRLRLSSVDAVEIDPLLFTLLVENARIAPHLHLSLQAGDDMILKRMKRRHLRADAIALTRRLRAARPEIAFGADLIAGFPTETEAMFENTLALVDDCDLAYLHVFPFSPRDGAPAARMPQVDPGVARERAARLRAKGEDATARWLDRHVGATRRALVERVDAEGAGLARLDDFAEIRLARGPMRAGAVIRARVTARDGARLTGVAETVEATA